METTISPDSSTITFMDDISENDFFHHIIHEVLNIHKKFDDPIRQWLISRAIMTISNLIDGYYHCYDSIDNMGSYKDTKGQEQQLPIHILSQLKIICHWAANWVLQNGGEPISRVSIFKITKREYQVWRAQLIDTGMPSPQSSLLTPLRTTRASPSLSMVSPSEQNYKDFRKATKRDASIYEDFKDEAHYDSWLRRFKVTAMAQGLSNIIDFSYKPLHADPYETLLYKEQQIFMYSVLVKIIQTDQGRSYVREHDEDHQATEVLKKIHHYHTKSEVAKQEVIRLTTYITNLKLTDDWKYTTRQFLLHFKEKFRLLDSLVSSQERIPDTTRLALLMHSVENVPDLRRIRSMDSVFRAKSGAISSLGYEEYFQLLMDAAFHLDHAVNTRGRKTNIQQHIQIQEHHICEHDIYEEEQNHHEYIHMDNEITETSHFDINMTRGKKEQKNVNNNVRVPLELWKTLPDEAKKIIVEYNRNLRQKPQRETNKEIQINECKIDESDNENPEENKPDFEGKDPLYTMVHELVSGNHDNDQTNDNKTRSVNHMDSFPMMPHTNRHINTHQHYVFAIANKSPYQLIDRGANGGLAGSDMKVISKTGRKINIVGIDNHELTGLDIVTAATLLPTDRGMVIGIFNEYAYYGKGKSIHSPGQLEWFKTKVDDKSVHIGGKQCMTTLDGYCIPFTIKEGLVYIQSAGLPTDQEMARLPHVMFTAPDEWDPSRLDYSHPPTNTPESQTSRQDRYQGNPLFDEHGEFIPRIITNLNILLDQPINYGEVSHLKIPTTFNVKQQLQLHQSTKEEHNWEEMRRYFAWTSIEHIKNTFKVSTRFAATAPNHDYIKKHYRTRNPALSIPRRDEAVATDTIFSDEKAIDGGYTMAQIFIGRDTLVCDIYGIKSTKQFINTLADNIRQRGAMNTLISDSATYQISERIVDLLRSLFIASYQSEPYHQHQNKAEIRYATVKSWTNTVMNITGCPAKCWLFCMEYVCTILNYMASPALNNMSPIQKLTGNTPDISFCLYFSFWEPVYFKVDKQEAYQRFPSLSNERKGRWIGFADHVGDALTWKILTDDTEEVIFRSAVRSAENTTPNARIDKPIETIKTEVESGSPTIFVRGRHDQDHNIMPTLDINDLIGRIYLSPPDENGDRHKTTIIKKVIEIDEQGQAREDNLKFLVKRNDQQHIEEIISYNHLIDHIQQDTEEDPNDRIYKFRQIVAHQGPLFTSDPHYKGSKYNILVEWETGENTYEPLNFISRQDPITCAIYAKQNDLLDLPGWIHLQRYVNLSKRIIRAMKTSKIRQTKIPIKYQFGIQVPRTYKEAVQLDEQNGNKKWQDAIETELSQISSYNTFTDYGKAIIEEGSIKNAPPDHQKIRVHLVFAIKHDGRHKARLVADGHLTPTPSDTVYSGVVSLKILRIVFFLAELQNKQIWAADIGNAYLEAETKEKLYIIAGPEFQELTGHILVIHKALYGLKSSGARWHDRLYDIMIDMDFKPTKADPDVWMRINSSRKGYEYVATYVDDLAIVMDDPETFIQILKTRYNLSIKGDGPLTYHLGCTYRRDPDGTLVADPKRYVEKLIEHFEITFGHKPKKAKPPLVAKDHPELDETELLDEKGITLYQSLIGQLQWLITLGRFDIATAVMSLSRYRVAPKQGHLERVKRIFGYLFNLPDAAIRYRTEEPDYSNIHQPQFDWSRTIYGNVKEIIPHDAPIALGKNVILTTYVDANLCHDVVTGRSVTGILHFINGTPIEWYSKQQATVETATYGSEFVAARTAIDQIIDIRTTLRYLGARLQFQSYLFGDNQSVITSSTIPTSIINKRHYITCFHKVREAIASGYVIFQWIESKNNPADVLSKHWEYATCWPLIRAMLFWRGNMNTQDLRDNGELHDSHING